MEIQMLMRNICSCLHHSSVDDRLDIGAIDEYVDAGEVGLAFDMIRRDLEDLDAEIPSHLVDDFLNLSKSFGSKMISDSFREIYFEKKDDLQLDGVQIVLPLFNSHVKQKFSALVEWIDKKRMSVVSSSVSSYQILSRVYASEVGFNSEISAHHLYDSLKKGIFNAEDFDSIEKLLFHKKYVEVYSAVDLILSENHVLVDSKLLNGMMYASNYLGSSRIEEKVKSIARRISLLLDGEIKQEFLINVSHYFSKPFSLGIDERLIPLFTYLKNFINNSLPSIPYLVCSELMDLFAVLRFDTLQEKSF